MKTPLTELSVLLLALLANQALACSCAPRPSTQSALDAAAFVVVADAVSSEQHPAFDDPKFTTVTEHATFRIVETLKGSQRPGDLLHVRSTIGIGACGVSARNSPVWLEELKTGKTVAPQLSGRWLIYARANEGSEATAIELSLCGSSAPMEAGGEGDVRRLRRLLRQTGGAKRSSLSPTTLPK